MEERVQKAWEFWNQFGKSPICLAPMAEVNDLAFRILCRRHNVKVCYTGMLNATQWVQGHKYQRRVFNTCPEDRPLIVQLASGDYDSIYRSAIDVSRVCDAVDINLGCTQHIASRGGYGFFMVETPEKRQEVIKLFQKLVLNVPVPITAKIRIFTKTVDEEGNPISEGNDPLKPINVPDVETTVDFARELEKVGVSVIAIHGRFQHRDKKADVSTEIIKQVVEALQIPVIANGGVNSVEDAKAILEDTNAAGVMIGQALISNPALFDEQPIKRRDFAREYLEIAKEHPEINMFAPKKHMFKFYEAMIKESPGIENEIKEATTFDELIAFIDKYDSD